MQESASANRTSKWKSFLKQIGKSIVCFALCLSLVWGYSYKEPTQAHATGVLTVAGFVIVDLAVAALGITIGNSMGNEFCKNVYDTIWTNGAAKLWDDGCYATEQIVNVTPAFLQYVGNQFLDIVDDGEASAVDLHSQLPDKTIDYINPVIDYDFISKIYGMEGWQCASGIGYNYFTNKVGDKTPVNGLWILGVIAPGINKEKTKEEFNLRFNKKVTTYKESAYDSYWEVTIDGITSGVSLPSGDIRCDSRKLYEYILAEYQVGTQKGYAFLFPSWYGDRVFRKLENNTATFKNGQSTFIPEKVVNHNGKAIGANSNTPAKVTEALQKKVGVTSVDGKVTIPLVNTGSNTEIDSNNRTQTQEQTTQTSIATDEDIAADDAADVGSDKTIPKPHELPDLSLPEIIFKEKFPFCLPWDIYRIVAGFYCSNTKVPKWTIPIKNKRLGIDSGITIDFSQFEPVAGLARWFNGALWVVGLILLSRKITGAGGGD